jgi:tetratricopeptide (TPR) repeat protein
MTTHHSSLRLWITDFGLARLGTDAGLTMTGDLIGTLRYMSPEQAMGNRVIVDHRTDIYSLGASLYELLTLEPVFSGHDRQELLRQIAFDDPKPLRRFNKAIPMELETIVLKAVEKNPADRYGTAKELAEDLQHFLDDKPIRARRPTALHKVKKWARRNQAMVTTGLVSFVVLVVTVALVATVAAWRTENARQAESTAKDRAERALEAESIAKNQAEDARKLAEARAEEIRSSLDRLNRANALMQSARFFTLTNQWAKALRDLSEAVALRPDNSVFWLERGELYHRLCLWDLAAADFAKGFQLQDAAIPRYWFLYALAEVYSGHPERYPEICARLRRHFDQTQDYMHQDNEIVRACTFAPSPSMDIGWVLATAQKTVERLPAERCNHHVVGLAYYRAGKYEQALHELHAAIENRPLLDDNPWFATPTYSVLALGHYRLGRTEEARQALANAAQSLDRLCEAELRAPVGIGQRERQDWLYAWMLFREATMVVEGAEPPEDARLCLMRGRALAALGQAEAAAECYGKAQKLRPDDQRIRLAILRGEHDPMIDRDKFSTMLAFFPFHVEGYYQRGLAYVRFGQFTEALADFGMVIALKPDDAGSYIQRGLIHTRQGHFDEGNANFRRIITLDSDPAKVAAELANTLQNRWEDYQEVIDYLARRVRLVEQDTKQSPKQREAAVQGYVRLVGKLGEEANKRYPEHDRGRTILAWFVGNYPDLRLRSPKLVLEMAQRAVQYTPEDGWAWTALGLAHYRTESWNPALEALQKGMPLRGGGDCNDWLLLAMTHWQLGHRAEALQWYGKASQWMESNFRKDGARFQAEAESLLGIPQQPAKGKEKAEAMPSP